jgi:hypothetical protein
VGRHCKVGAGEDGIGATQSGHEETGPWINVSKLFSDHPFTDF